MTIQRSVASRDAGNNAHATQIGTTGALLKLFSGALPANCAAADPSGLLATISLPATPIGASASGAMANSGTWSVAASASGTALSYRIYNSGGTCHEQGTVGQSATAVTSALTAVNGNVLTFASAPAGFVVGMNLSGTGIPAGTTIVAISGGSVTMSKTSIAGVASGATITASPDLALNNAVLASGQTVTITYSLTAGDA